MDLFTGAVCFSLNRSDFRSRLIAWWTGGRSSHTFVGCPSFLGRPMILEMGAHGGAVRPWDHYRRGAYSYAIYFPVKAGPWDVTRALETMSAYLGQPYGFGKALAIGARLALARLGIHWRGTRNADLVCSTLVLMYLKALGGEYARAIQGMTPETVTPAELERRVLSRPDLFDQTEVKGFTE